MTISVRLKEERLRLKLSQTDLGAAGGVGKTTQINYEKGAGSPDATYLAAVAEKGVDIFYVVTGQRLSLEDRTLSTDEMEMVEIVRSLNEDDKGAVKRLLQAFNQKR
ncbi:helix-turn-helix domain-containing protein [Pseudomonas sp. PSPC2-3]|jgi:transcriptional regulator with XRE-family HTH domain|uniref:helix-turn-helix domain-containing protein n=1 Tax=Pseudomonas sp. PSPC2-3 TaxID=2804561 RepID=UPI002049D7FA|nr:MAG TPA: hypothetical protein [Caudoviricetes sp.]